MMKTSWRSASLVVGAVVVAALTTACGKDSPWPMKTACTGACLKKWPVVAPVAAKDTQGIDLRGSGPRGQGYVVFDWPDGLEQQTVDCVPLYTFAGDDKPGDINGQGVGGTWFAIRPDGKPVGAPEK